MLKETIQTTLVHFNRAKDNVEDIKKFPVNITIYENKEKISLNSDVSYKYCRLPSPLIPTIPDRITRLLI